MNKSSYTYRDSCLAFLFSLVAFLITSLVFSLIVSSIASSSGQEASDILSLPTTSIISSLLSELAFFSTFIIYTRSNKKKVFKDSAFSCKVGLGLGSLMVLFGFAIVLCSLNFTGLFSYIFSSFANSEAPSIGLPLDTFPQFLLGVLVLAVLPAICEELIFRGIILNGLFKRFKPFLAIVIASALFALIHMSVYLTIHQFILGLELGLVLYLTGNLAYCIILHFANNFLVVLSNYLFKDNFPLEITSWGLPQVLIAIGAFLLGVGITILFVKFLARKKLYDKNTFALEGENEAICEDVDKSGTLAQRITDKVATTMLLVSVAFCMLLWITSSFGG